MARNNSFEIEAFKPTMDKIKELSKNYNVSSARIISTM